MCILAAAQALQLPARAQDAPASGRMVKVWWVFGFPPRGAVGLMVTWEAGHFFSKDLRTAIYAVFISYVIGMLHFANRKDIWPSLIFWLVGG